MNVDCLIVDVKQQIFLDFKLDTLHIYVNFFNSFLLHKISRRHQNLSFEVPAKIET